jgi:hypothetical protein
VNLTADRVVITDSNKQLSSSNVTSTELNYLSGVTSSIQTQINSKVNKAGDTLTGRLNSTYVGTSTLPNFSIGNSGIYSSLSNHINIATNSLNRVDIDDNGVVSILNLSTGILHSSSLGVLTSSLIVNADIQDATIGTEKLLNVSVSNSINKIVLRDGFGNFQSNMITLLGTTTNPTDVATKSYVDTVVNLGLSIKAPVIVVAVSNQPITGLYTIDSVLLVDGNRVLLTGQTSAIDNGGWVAHAGAWTRPTDFNTGTTAMLAYFLVLQGALYIGSSWVCSTPAAVIGTDPLIFTQFSLPQNIDGINNGVGSGLVYESAAGSTLRFRTLLSDTYMNISTLTDEVKIGVLANSTNVVSTLVARDSSGNFTAGTITASLTGHASEDLSLNGGIMTGVLLGYSGSSSLPGISIGSNDVGLSENVGNLQLSTNGLLRFNIGTSGIVTISNLNAVGVVHNDASGLLTTSLIINSDITPGTILNSSLSTISSTSLPNTIVVRDGSNNFAANVITANLIGDVTGNLVGTVTGHATLDVLLSGSTMTGPLGLPIGTAGTPSLQVGDSKTGLYNNSGALNFSTNGTLVMGINSSGTLTIANLSTGILHSGLSGIITSSLIVTNDITALNITTGLLADGAVTAIKITGPIDSKTSATSSNTPNTIVSRDGSGNFSAGTITASLTGSASLNLLLTGGTLTGNLILPNGSSSIPSLQVGSSTVGLSASSGILQLSTTFGIGLSIQSATGIITLPSLSTLGVVHNSSAGVLSTSLILNADITVGTIGNDKLVTLSTAGLVLNSATTATSANTISAIVARDASGNFSAGTITATITGHSSLDLPLSGGTLTGNLILQNGLFTSPSLQVGSSTVGLSASSGILQLSTAFGIGLSIQSATGIITLPSLSTLGVVHNSAAGILSTSLILNADITVGTIGNDKLVTLSTAGLVLNSATTATSANTISAIVARDASGNFSAGTITATITGHSSLDLPLTGGTLTGNLILPNGTFSVPSLQVGSSTVGLSASSGILQLSTAFGIGLSIQSATGVITLPSLSTLGVVHNSSAGILSTSLILNADITVGTIGNDKLVTLSTAGLVLNSATTATSANTPSAIVARDGSGNFTAGTITASLTGSSSLNLLLTGGTLTGNLILQNGSFSSPSLQVGSSTVGLSASSGILQLSTAFGIGLSIQSATGVITLPSLSTLGVVHNSSAGILSTSLILNADITVGTIGNDKLVTLSTAGLVLNSATTATSANTPSAIVARDGSGNFTAGTITASLTGSSSLNLLLTGGTLTGNLILPNGTSSVPSLQVGSSTVGLSASSGILQLSTAFGIGLSIQSATGVITLPSLSTLGVVHNSAAGVLSTSLILNADITVGTIGNDKLVTLSTAGLVLNSATTATSANTINTIVLRDGSGNFTAGTITASAITSPILDNSAGLSIGTTNATSVTIGKAAVVTTVNGIFNTTVSLGSWYSTTNFQPGWANTNYKVIPPTAATAGSLSEFTHATGVLTYTGTRTRTFYVTYNISVTLGVTGANLTFSPSKNASTVIGNQTQLKEQVNASNTATSNTVNLNDFVTLATGDTIQLMAKSDSVQSTTNGGTFNFVSCQIFGFLN